MLNIVPPIERHEIVKIKVRDAGLSQYKFEPINILKAQKIKGFRLYGDAELSIDEAGSINALNYPVLITATITLKTKGGIEVLNKMPLQSIQQFAQNAMYIPTNDLVIDWETSYITLPPNSLTVGSVILVGVFFNEHKK